MNDLLVGNDAHYPTITAASIAIYSVMPMTPSCRGDDYVYGMVVVTAYDSRWPAMAAAAIAELSPLLPVIEHIGSTAVPGLAAKPTIDLMAAVPALSSFDARLLTPLNYERHINAMTDRLLFVRWSGAARTHILHVVTLDTWPTRNQRLLRDYLRANPSEAARYGALKRSLAAAGNGPHDYTRAKTTLIQELTDKARAAAGLPSVPVWEKPF
ncbi:GrpB family protein [Paractinoplanes lichenicola]|uniref:GrpB family protein n=1 Tax=Paractinoplanes lichenicola TaxID=2802976 RepID=A0ABS1VYT1_9ACTN|nr:GrpB family protein [Actinoplanes lichenicola]MBL7259458.1 GrpB family protein [Actinoplanes lichenicola]